MQKSRASVWLIAITAVLIAGSAVAQVEIRENLIKIGPRKVLATFTCGDGQIAKWNAAANAWVCGDDSGGGGGSEGLCTLYSLTGNVPDVSLGCPAQLKKVVFVTSTTYDGNLGGLAGADSICTTRKNAAGLSGTYKAWIAGSSSTSAPDTTFTKAAATTWYVNTTDNIVAIGWDDLTDGNIARNLNIDEFGNLITSNFTVWTNVALDGTRLDSIKHCNNWTDDFFDDEFVPYSVYCSNTDAEEGRLGSASTTTQSWTQGGERCCDADFGTGNPPNPNFFQRLLCFQQ